MSDACLTATPNSVLFISAETKAKSKNIACQALCASVCAVENLTQSFVLWEETYYRVSLTYILLYFTVFYFAFPMVY